MATPLRHLLWQRRAAPVAAPPLVGTWSLLGSAAAAQTLAGQGFDFVVVDREHSDLSTRDASAIVAALVARGVAPAVRLLPARPGRQERHACPGLRLHDRGDAQRAYRG